MHYLRSSARARYVYCSFTETYLASGTMPINSKHIVKHETTLTPFTSISLRRFG